MEYNLFHNPDAITFRKSKEVEVLLLCSMVKANQTKSTLLPTVWVVLQDGKCCYGSSKRARGYSFVTCVILQPSMT